MAGILRATGVRGPVHCPRRLQNIGFGSDAGHSVALTAWVALAKRGGKAFGAGKARSGCNRCAARPHSPTHESGSCRAALQAAAVGHRSKQTRGGPHAQPAWKRGLWLPSVCLKGCAGTSGAARLETPGSWVVGAQNSPMPAYSARPQMDAGSPALRHMQFISTGLGPGGAAAYAPYVSVPTSHTGTGTGRHQAQGVRPGYPNMLQESRGAHIVAKRGQCSAMQVGMQRGGRQTRNGSTGRQKAEPIHVTRMPSELIFCAEVFPAVRLVEDNYCVGIRGAALCRGLGGDAKAQRHVCRHAGRRRLSSKQQKAAAYAMDKACLGERIHG